MGGVSENVDYIYRFGDVFERFEDLYTEYFLSRITGVYEVDLVLSFLDHLFGGVIRRPFGFWRYADNSYHLSFFESFKGIVLVLNFHVDNISTVWDLKSRIFPNPRVNTTKPVLWVHCASVGEFNTFRPLIDYLREDFFITLTYFSPRAKEYMLRNRSQVDALFPLPLDLPFSVRRFEEILKPKALIVVERELWPILISKVRAKKILLNAYAKGSFLENRLMKHFHLVIARTKADAQVFLREGAKNVVVCGNLKVVQDTSVPAVEVPRPFGKKIFVAGSVRPGEEEVILSAFLWLRNDIKEVSLVVAPRHIKECNRVLEFFKKAFTRVYLKSEAKEGWDVLVVDTLGELRGFYAMGNVAFVGGTFVKVGGHNLMEPALLGKPVLFGPYTHKVKDMEEILKRVGMGFKVLNAWDLYVKTRDLLTKGFEPKGDLKALANKVKDCYLSTLKSSLIEDSI